MKKLSRYLIMFLVFLAVLTPTYILIYHVSETVAPAVTVGDKTLDPAFLRWQIVRKNDTTSDTSFDPKEAERDFQTYQVTLEDLVQISYEREPYSVQILFYNLDESSPLYDKNELYLTTTPEDLRAQLQAGYVLPSHSQIMLALQWQVGDTIRIQAMYSLEATPA